MAQFIAIQKWEMNILQYYLDVTSSDSNKGTRNGLQALKCQWVELMSFALGCQRFQLLPENFDNLT